MWGGMPSMAGCVVPYQAPIRSAAAGTSTSIDDSIAPVSPKGAQSIAATQRGSSVEEQDGGMPGGHRPDRRPLTRADLPERFTPDTVRRLDVFTIRRSSQPGNGVLTSDEQCSFDEALRNVMQDTTERLEQPSDGLGRVGRSVSTRNCAGHTPGPRNALPNRPGSANEPSRS